MSPYGDLIISGNILYGMTTLGGLNMGGTIFTIHTDGSDFKKLFDFTNESGAGPLGTLMLQDNVLYGSTLSGGVNGHGTLFSINTNGSGFKKILDFNILNGQSSRSKLIMVGNKLYGNSEAGGTSGNGNIFSIYPDGKGYKNLLNFDGGNGALFRGALTFSDGIFYGMTCMGGTYGKGGVFSFKDSSSVVNVFPNPVNGDVIINCMSDLIGSSLKITDFKGLVVYSEENSLFTGVFEKTLNMSDYPAGIYFMQLILGTRVTNRKIVIQN